MPGDPSIVIVSEDRVTSVTVQQPIVQVVQVAAVGPQGPPGPVGSTNLDGLTDVTITDPLSGQALVYNGSQWVNQAVSSVGSLDDLTDVTITTPAAGNVLRYNGSQWANGSVAYSELTGVPSTFAPSAHTHVAADVVSGTFSDARIAGSSVTQHQALLSIDWGQLTSVPSTFPPSAHTHVAADVVSGTFSDARIAGSSVTQHQALLSIDWGQLTSVPSTFPPSAHTHVAADVTDFSTAVDARIAAASVDALADVTITSPATGQYLRYNGSQWVNASPNADIDARIAAANLDDLANVVVPSPSTNQVLLFNGTNWVNAAVPAVTSVGLSLPSIFTVSGSPVTSTGTLTAALATQSANHVLAGPLSGGAAVPTFRALNSADVAFVPDMVDEVQASRKAMLASGGFHGSGGFYEFSQGALKHNSANSGIQRCVIFVEVTGPLSDGVIVGVKVDNWTATRAFLRVGGRCRDVFGDSNEIVVPWTDLTVINNRFAIEAELAYTGASGTPVFYIANNSAFSLTDLYVLTCSYTQLIQNSITEVP